MKQSFLDFLNEIGFVWKYALNGLVGGLIWSMYVKSKFWTAVRQIFIGGVVSGYSTPLIVQYTGMDLSFVGFTSFVVGMLGMVVIDTIYKQVVKIIKKWKEAIIIINQKN